MNRYRTIPFHGEVELTYDPESPEFIESLDSYTSCIDKHGTADKMLEQIAWTIVKRGADRPIEGIGYVQVAGRDKPSQDFCGVVVNGDYDELFID